MLSVWSVGKVVMLADVHGIPIVLAIVRVIANGFHSSSRALPPHDMSVVSAIVVRLYHLEFVRSLLHIPEMLQSHRKRSVSSTDEAVCTAKLPTLVRIFPSVPISSSAKRPVAAMTGRVATS